MNRVSILCVLLSMMGSLLCTNNISVVGIGRLGICAALCFENAGFGVLGVDTNQDHVDQINSKLLESFEPSVREYLEKSRNFRATCSLDEALEFADIIFIYVDTPTTIEKAGYDHKNLNCVLSEINKRKVKNKHIVIGCTVFPGYVAHEGKILIADCESTTLSYNPEFIAQGSIIRDFLNPSMILIGQGSITAGDIIENIYKIVCHNSPVVCRMSPISAEITKLTLNCFITTKIAFANAIADVADSSWGANKYDILHAIGCDARINGKCLMPGYGYGGPCFPRDNRALASYAELQGVDLLISRATDEANKQHAEFMVNQFLHANQGAYLFEDVAYKENCAVPIIEESQKLLVASRLANLGKQVIVKDKKSVIDLVQKQYGDLFCYQVIV